MRNFILFLSFMLVIALMPLANAFEGLNGSTSLGIFNKIKCGSSVTCTGGTLGVMTVETSGTFATDIVGDGTDVLYGFLENQVTTSTSDTLTAAQCGSTFINGAAIQLELPEASTVLGCRYTFVTGNASNFDVNPDDADQILVLTNAAGDAIRNATLGNSVILQAISATEWAQLSGIGTWSDIN